MVRIKWFQTLGTHRENHILKDGQRSVSTTNKIYRMLAYKVKRVARTQARLILGTTPKVLRQC